MANRYWVGGTGTWDTSDTSHWSTSSGGASGASVPTSADAVFIDGSSGASTFTITVQNPGGDIVCGGLDCTGANIHIFTSNTGMNFFKFYGSVKFVANTTFDINTNFGLYGAGAQTLDFAGKTFLPSYSCLIYEATAVYTLTSGGFTIGGMSVNVSGAKLDCNDYSFTIYSQGFSVAGGALLDLGNGTITLELYSAFTNAGTITNAGTSTLKFTNNTYTVTNTFGTSQTYYNIWFDGIPTNTHQITLNATTACTFNEFKVTTNTNVNHCFTFIFNYSVSWTATSWIFNGTDCDSIVKVHSSYTTVTLNDTAGTNTSNYVHFKNVTVAGGATFNAVSCTLTGCSGFTTSGTACVYNRYWVGGTATWDGTAGSKWAETSGGTSGKSVPNQLYNVYFDANSGASTITPSGYITTKDLIFIGFTGTLADTASNNEAYLQFYGTTLTLGSGMICNATKWQFQNNQVVDDITVTTNGKRLMPFYSGSNISQQIIFADAITACTGIYHFYGIMNFGNFNHSIGCYGSYNGGITLGSGTLTITDAVMSALFPQWTPSGTSVFGVNYSNDTSIVQGTSTIKFTDTSSTTVEMHPSEWSTSTADAGYYNIWFDRGSSTGTNRIRTHLQCNELKDTGTAKHNLEIVSVKTITYTTLTVSGASCSDRIVLKAVTAASAAILKKTSGTTSISYVEAKDITSNGGLTSFTIGTSYIDGGGNTGITFSGSICPSSNIKVFNGLVYASVKTVNGLAIASVKTKLGLA